MSRLIPVPIPSDHHLHRMHHVKPGEQDWNGTSPERQVHGRLHYCLRVGYLMARQLDANGRSLFEATVPVRGGSLAFVPGLDAHVLHERDHGFGGLVAVMQGLDCSAERLLQHTLGAGDKPCPRMDVDDLDPTDLNEILEIMDKVRQTQL